MSGTPKGPEMWTKPGGILVGYALYGSAPRAADAPGGGRAATLSGRALLSGMLLAHFGIDLSAETDPVRIAPGGKPYLAHHPEIFFNISHSGDLAACAAGPVPVGIDVQIRPARDVLGAARRILTEREWETFLHCSDPAAAFCRIWTRKESFVKYTGEGIRRDLRTLDDADVRYYPLTCPPGIYGTLCAPRSFTGAVRELRCEAAGGAGFPRSARDGQEAGKNGAIAARMTFCSAAERP